MPAPPVLLYDGTCGFCAASVQFVLKRDRKGTLLFAPLNGAYGRAVIERHPELRSVDSVLWLAPDEQDGERVFSHSAAAMQVAQYLGGAWPLLNVARIVPASIRDAVYRLIAKHRHRVTNRRCFIPTAAQSGRFLS